jgi:hypothetical protein
VSITAFWGRAGKKKNPKGRNYLLLPKQRNMEFLKKFGNEGAISVPVLLAALAGSWTLYFLALGLYRGKVLSQLGGCANWSWQQQYIFRPWLFSLVPNLLHSLLYTKHIMTLYAKGSMSIK